VNCFIVTVIMVKQFLQAYIMYSIALKTDYFPLLVEV